MPSVLFKIATWVQMRRVHTSGDARVGQFLVPSSGQPLIPQWVPLARSVGRSGNFSSGTTDGRGANGPKDGRQKPLGDGFQGTSICETTWKEMKGVSWMGYMQEDEKMWKSKVVADERKTWWDLEIRSDSKRLKVKVIGGEEKRCGDVAMWCCGNVMMLLYAADDSYIWLFLVF